MSEATLRDVIGHAILDLEYRELLFKDPDEALEGLDLTTEEVATLKAMERIAFEAEGDELEVRLSRVAIPNPQPTSRCFPTAFLCITF
jgi:hypothetical protein